MLPKYRPCLFVILIALLHWWNEAMGGRKINMNSRKAKQLCLAHYE